MSDPNDWRSVTTAVWHRWVLPAWLARAVRWLTSPLYGGRPVDAITWSHTTVFLIPAPIPWDLQRHELQHVMQAVRYEISWWPWWLGRCWTGTLRYGGAYVWEYLRHGYEGNRFEREARIAAGQE